ncbi:MAG: hypothetical protein WBW73_09445 [Rhodoplanes sp.]
MFKSASSNHSLWPEQARPRKAKQQSALVIGAFCIGAVAAISAHNVLTELSTPAQEPVQQASLTAAPVYATPGATSAESAKATSASLAAAKLLSASTAPAVPSSATDGRGGATADRSGEALATGAAAIAATAASSAPPVKAGEIAKPADSLPAKAAEIAKPAVEPPAQKAEIAKPVAEPTAQPVETAAKPAAPERPKTVRRRRDPNYYARRRNQQIFPFFGFLNAFGRRG